MANTYFNQLNRCPMAPDVGNFKRSVSALKIYRKFIGNDADKNE